MPRFDFGLSGADVGAAEGYEAYGGPLPKTGSYTGKLKIVQISETSQKAKNPGAPMLKVGVEINDADQGVAGFVAFRNLVIVDSVIPFVNQFLRALTDGSDAEFEKVKKAFWDDGPVVDDTKKNIHKIGNYKINSPEGQLPIKVSLKQRSYTPEGSTESRTVCEINSFLLSEGAAGSGSSSSDDEPIAEEDDSDTSDGSVFDLDVEDEESVESA
jgi:hypothetical protein